MTKELRFYLLGLNRPKSIVALQLNERANTVFSGFAQHNQKDVFPEGITVEDYLMKPVQRICKYPVFLKRLIETYDENDFIYIKLSLATKHVSQVIMAITEIKKSLEQGNPMPCENKKEIQPINIPPSRYAQENSLLIDIFQKLKDPTTGLSVSTQAWFSKKYPDVFKGTDLIQWLGKHFQYSKKDAKKVSSNLLKAKMIQNASCTLSSPLEYFTIIWGYIVL